jgi:hypothetical protein
MRFAIHHFPTIPTSVLCTINTVGGIYEATRDIPLAASFASDGNGGVDASDGSGTCNSDNSNSGSSDVHGEQYAAANSYPATAWYKSTFDTGEHSLNYHWAEHGRKYGKTMEEYTNDAEEFFAKNKQNAKPVVLNDGSPGLRIRISKGPGGYFTLSGQVVSFWYK